MRAKKLPSGAWRCRAYVGEEIVDGKRKVKTKSVTVNDPTQKGRIRCEAMAAELEEKAKAKQAAGITVREAIDAYIKKRSSRSVQTLAGYRMMEKNYYTEIIDTPVRALTSDTVQGWLDRFALSHSPKTCRNAYGLLCASVRAVEPSADLRTELPEKEPTAYYTPTEEDVANLLALADPVMQKAILLAAYGTLRSGEVCALTYGDIDGTMVRVDKDLRWDGHGYVLGNCKNPQSRRTVYLPEDIIERIGAGEPEERIVPLNPSRISDRFGDLRDELGLTECRFHDLRAFAASLRHSLGVPDAYIMADGGWKTDQVMKRVYRRAMDDKRKELAELLSGRVK